MSLNQPPPNPPRIYPSSLDEFARPEIAAELARREQRLAGSAQPAAASTPAVVLKKAPPAQSTAPTATAPAALMIRASELNSLPINWVWPGRIARAKLTLLAGAPGSGKSAFAMSVIAAVTTGGSYPCDEGRAPKGSVILVAPRGDADVLVPRLNAAGADLERVHIITHAPGAQGSRPFDLNTDLLLLVDAIQSLDDLRVVVVDAVNLSGGRAAEQMSRSVLDRLAILAEGRDVSILALVQTAPADRGARKPATLDALTLGTARAAFVIEADPADANRKLLLQAKNELAGDPGTLAFRIGAQEIDAAQTAARVAFEPQYHSLSANEFAARQSRGFNSARAEGFEFLRSLFGSTSELAIGQVEQEARAAGLIKDKQTLNQCRVLREARLIMGLAMTRDARDRWVWAKPNSRKLTVASPPLQPQKTAQLKPSSPNAAM
ncbi:MAG: AAA family ATPase [Xanthobacteraceae bacterium]|nr:AAA family ATPase [Xanthobacteraceae bacterium]MBV9630712.1 AAA family ATPase [Xanthobacteraceae bacterium]